MRALSHSVALLVLLWGAVASAAWPGVPYTEVRGYAWPSDRTGATVLDDHGKAAAGAQPAQGRLLTPPQVERLLEAQKRRSTPRPRAGCYAPHHAFVFYQQQKPVAFLELCLDCLGARVWPEDAQCDPDFLLLGELCAELKFPLGRFQSLAEFRAATAPIMKAP